MENKEIIKNIEEAKRKLDLLIQWYKRDLDKGSYGDIQLAISWIIEPLKKARIQCVKKYEEEHKQKQLEILQEAIEILKKEVGEQNE